MPRLTAAVLALSLWLGFGLMTLLLTTPGGASGVLMLTFGLGVVTFPVPTLWFYLSATMPGWALFLAPVPKRFALLVGGLGLLGAAFVPSLASQWVAWRDLAALTSGDRQAPLPVRPAHLRVWERGMVRGEDPVADFPCGPTCQRLLYGDEVQAVEVAVRDRHGEVRTAVWRRERRAGCPPAFQHARLALPAVTDAMARGDCLVVEAGAALPDAPWVSLVPADYREVRDATWWPVLHRVRSIYRVQAGGAATPRDEPEVVQTRVVSHVLRRPSLFLPNRGDLQSFCLELWRRPHAPVGTSLDDVVRDLFGYRAADLQEPPPADLSTLRALLDQPGDATFGPDVQGLFHDALNRVARGDAAFPPEDEALFERMLRDRRVIDLYPLGDLLRRRPAMAVRLVPAVVERVGMPVDGSVAHSRARMVRLLFEVPAGQVLPHVDALREAYAQDRAWGTVALLPLVSLGAADAGELVDEAFARDDPRWHKGAVAAVCNGDEAFAAPRLDRVAAMLTEDVDDGPAALVVRALRRHGRGAVADAWLAGLDDRRRAQVLQQVDRYAWEGVPGGCGS